MCVSLCTLSYTTQHRAVLIIFRLILQTSTRTVWTTELLSVGGEGWHAVNTPAALKNKTYCNKTYWSQSGIMITSTGWHKQPDQPTPWELGDNIPHLTKVKPTGGGSTQVTKSVPFNTEFILRSSCNFSHAPFIFQICFLCIFRSTLLSRLNNLVLKCPSVRPSTKSFFDFNEIWHVGRRFANGLQGWLTTLHN